MNAAHRIARFRCSCGYVVCRQHRLVVVCKCGWRTSHLPHLDALDAHNDHVNDTERARLVAELAEARAEIDRLREAVSA